MQPDLTQQIALITGGAVRLGRAICIALARRGADIALHHNSSSDAARATAQEIEALGRKVHLLQADLSDPAAIERMFAQLTAETGRLDILVNSASRFTATPLESLTAEQWDIEQAVNVRAPALCIHHAIALMPHGGSIINIGDSAAERGRRNFIAYCASKGGLAYLTRSAARALAGQNIRVNMVSPGVAAWPPDATEEQKQHILRSVPMGRAGTAEDIAQAVAFLASSAYITGQNLRVDGGWNTD